MSVLNNRKLQAFGVCVVFAISALVFTKMTYGFIPIPIWMRYFCHRVFEPSDLYQSLVLDSFPFWEQGYSKTYLLKPKYLDVYELGVLFGEQKVPASLKISGKISVELFVDDKRISGKIITSAEKGIYAGVDLENHKAIILTDFELPIHGKYLRGVSIKISVLEPIKEWKQYQDSARLYVAVSSSP